MKGSLHREKIFLAQLDRHQASEVSMQTGYSSRLLELIWTAWNAPFVQTFPGRPTVASSSKLTPHSPFGVVLLYGLYIITLSVQRESQ